MISSSKKFSIGIFVLDCTGCGVYVSVWNDFKKALSLKPINTQLKQQDCFLYDWNLSKKDDITEKFNENKSNG